MNKRFTDLFIKRPILAIVINIILLLAGLISLSKLAVREFPRIDASVISINTSYPGASANLMETQVTDPIENAIAGVDGLDYISSTNTLGSSSVLAYFRLGYNIDTAIADVINKVSSVKKHLPTNIYDPIIDKQDPNASPILYIAFTDPTVPRVAIHDYLTRAISPILSTIPGVGYARIFGSMSYAMRIWLDPWQMASHNVTIDDIKNALNNSNLQSATGLIEAPTQELATNLNSQLSTPKQFNQIVVQQNKGIPVHIGDIGYAEMGTPELRVNTLINQKTANIVGIIPRNDANPLAVADATHHALLAINKQLPKTMKSAVIWDNGKFIRKSLSEVKKAIAQAVFFVVIVIFLFLGSWRTVLIPMVTIPLSLAAVFTPMFIMNYSINTLTLLALVLAIGLVVDDAIVVSENIHRNILLGLSRFEAAIQGAREIAFAIIAMTLTLAAVYTPIIFMQGLTGELFKEFAFALATIVIISGFIALTLSPMMCAHILPEHNQISTLEQKIHHAMDIITFHYHQKLLKVISFHKVIVYFILAIIGLGSICYWSLPKELAPKEDNGAIMVLMNAPSAASLAYTSKYAQQVDNIVKKVPEVENRILIEGIPNGVHSALMYLTLKDWNQRKRTSDDIIHSLFSLFSSITGVTAMPINPFKLPGSSNTMGVSFVVKTTGSYENLYQVSQKILAEANKNPALVNVDTDLKYDQPEISFDINRPLAADLGISISSIADSINLALSELEFNQFVLNGYSYYVLPELLPEYRRSPNTLNYLYLRTQSNQLVSLSAIVTEKQSIIPGSLNHFQQMRSVTFTANSATGYTQGQALNAIEKIATKYLTPDMSYDFAGTTRQFIRAQNTMGNTFVFALLFIFLILAAQFESFRDPLIVMITVPLSITGALLILKLFHGTINIYTEIGLVTLIGLISKHGILMVEFANQLKKSGKNSLDAIIEAACVRLRPILMTTSAMVLGALPLLLASGAGSESRYQIGLTIIGGMTFGTLLTLFVIPIVYTKITSK